MLIRLIEHGLAAAGRYLRLRDRRARPPGALAGSPQAVAELGPQRARRSSTTAQGVAVGVDEVELLLTLETRDPAHRLEVVDRLRSSGYQVEQL